MEIIFGIFFTALFLLITTGVIVGVMLFGFTAYEEWLDFRKRIARK